MASTLVRGGAFCLVANITFQKMALKNYGLLLEDYITDEVLFYLTKGIVCVRLKFYKLLLPLLLFSFSFSSSSSSPKKIYMTP